MDVNLSVYPNTNSPVKAEDKLSMMCVAEINKTLIDVNVSIEVHLTGSRIVNTTTIENSNLGLFITSISFSSITAVDAGNFNCNVTVNAASTSEFVKPIFKEDNFDLILSKSEKFYRRIFYFNYSTNQFLLSLLSI